MHVPRPAHELGASVLLAEDDDGLARALRRMLESADFRVAHAPDAQRLATELEAQPELVLLDLRLGDADGTALIESIRDASPDSEIVVMTGFATVDSAVECMRLGAFDYLAKPFEDRERVVHTLRSALERRALRVRNRELEVELDQRSALEHIAGRSAPMRRVVRTVRDLSRNESNVLIQGESGTGKELIARAIHETSPRRGGSFVPVDCGALPEGIVEGELFGYERGAFTGASRASPGLIRSANGGTLFLDEVGELPLLMQAKLLRAIQEREVRPLGTQTVIAVDVRIIAATNRDLEREVRDERFRADLFYRLRVVSIAVPPLRERPEDIALLTSHFLERHAANADASAVTGIAPDALDALVRSRWDGNVRELENTIEAAVALARGPRLTTADLRLEAAPRNESALPTVDRPDGIPLSLEAYERDCLERALAEAQGDVRRAAELLGVGRSTLYRKLRSHGLKN